MSLDELKKSEKITDEMHEKLVSETKKKLNEAGYFVRDLIHKLYTNQKNLKQA